MSLAITINGDVRLAKKLNKLSAAIQNPKKALKEVGKFVISETQEQFKTEGTRLGRKWKELATSTLIAKARDGYGGKGMLERTGRLKKGFKSDLSKFKVRIHNPVPYYQYHQLGGTKLPQRVMLDTPERVKQEIVGIFLQDIKKALK